MEELCHINTDHISTNQKKAVVVAYVLKEILKVKCHQKKKELFFQNNL